MSQVVSCVIIGGGIAGLSAAYYAEQQGIDFLVIDSTLDGGVMKTSYPSGFICDDGPNVFVEKPALTDLLLELGLTDACRYSAVSPYKQHVYYRGVPTEVPKSPIAFVRSPFFRFRDKLAIVASLLGLKKQVLKGSDSTIAEVFIPLIGERAVYTLLEPALQGIYGGRVDDLSTRMVFDSLWDHLSSQGCLKNYTTSGKKKKNIVVLKDGSASLTNTLMERLPARALIQDTVLTLTRETDSFRVHCASGSSFSSSSVIVTTAGAATAGYLKGVAPDLSSSLEALSFAPLLMMHLSIPRNSVLPERSFGVLFPPGRPSGLLGVMCKSLLFPHVAPSNRHLLTVSAGGVGKEQLLTLDDEVLQEMLINDVQETLGINEAECLGISRWKRAIPQYHVGHRDHIIQHMDTIETTYKGLYFAGVDKRGVGVPDRIAFARDIVNHRLKQFLER